jgi:hypothetical protein
MTKMCIEDALTIFVYRLGEQSSPRSELEQDAWRTILNRAIIVANRDKASPLDGTAAKCAERDFLEEHMRPAPTPPAELTAIRLLGRLKAALLEQRKAKLAYEAASFGGGHAAHGDWVAAATTVSEILKEIVDG